jgi:beta-lactamase regulating signal transducer with metallopeptidase domain
MTFLLIARVTVLLFIGLLAYFASVRASAALRHAILVATTVAALALPFTAPVAQRSIPLRVRSDAAPVQAVVTRLSIPVRSAVWENSSGGGTARIVIALWMSGVVLLSLRLAFSWRAALRLRRGEAIRWRGRDVLLSDSVATPLTVGLLHPTIVLPRTMRDCEAALLHEAAHISRGDAWSRLIIELACAVYWFHPLIWIAARRAVLEQERACDDAALGAGVPPVRYAELLISVATRERRTAALSMAAARQLEARLHAVVDDARPRRKLTPPAFGVTAFLAGALLLTTASVTIVAAPLLGSFEEPWSEELPDVALVPPFAADGADAALAHQLREAAVRPKTWRGDLVAERARWALSRAHDGKLIAPLREALNDDDWRVRAYAAWALGNAKDRVAVPRLIVLLRDPVWRMRAMAASALANINDDAAAAAMERALGDTAWQVRYEAVVYVGARTDARSRSLVARMTNDPHAGVRYTAEDAAARF